MDDLIYTSASDLIGLYRSREASPVDAVSAVLARVDAVNGTLNAYCLVDHEGALAAARASEARWAKGEPVGLLDGVPASIKDLILTTGWPTLRGSLTVDENQAWDEDAPCTARLKEAGAILIGKTTTPEFGWKGVTDNARTGITRNPWNTEKTPGGSSGGAAAQVAAGMGPLAIGTDGGGSIRIPSGFSGIFGHKPSFGRVPAYPLSPFGTVAHVGPMTRTVTDGALMLTVISQPDVRDWFALPYDGADYRDSLEDGIKGMRIAYSPDLGYAKVHPEVAACVDQAVKAFTELGAHVEQVDPGFANPHGMFTVLWYAGAANGLRSLSESQLALVEPALVEVMHQGREIPLLDYMAAVNERGQLGIAMREFHTRYDLLVTPSLAVPAFGVGLLEPEGADGEDWTSWTPFTYPFNLTQQPAASVPCGFTSDGLPIGLQIVGPMHDDALVLRAARSFETARPWADKRPDLP